MSDETDPQPAMSPEEWLVAYAAALGVEAPHPDTIEVLLDLAGTAAHASQRTAAPIACWLAAQAGLDPVEALVRARAVAG